MENVGNLARHWRPSFVVIAFTQSVLQYAYPATVSAGTFNAPTLLTNSSSHGSR
jgi:hypothetical protein